MKQQYSFNVRRLFALLRPGGVILFLMLGVAVGASAQSMTVSGTVTDEAGEPLIGASILVQGTTTGTITDIDGTYSLNVEKGATMVVSYTGYAAQTIEVGNQTTIDITMQPDAEILSEIVVTGYQTQRKRDISGAVSVVKTDELETMVTSSFAQKLAGRAPGVTVSSSGAPGDVANVRIRGISSFGSNDPLYIIDGIPVQDKGNLNINPNDIESMQVLKDASTASIYGSRASNGVIVITTKKGKAGKTKLSYSGSVSAVNPVKGWNDILITDSDEYLDMTKQFFENGGAALPSYVQNGQLTQYIFPASNSVDESTYDRYNNPIMKTSSGTDWWDAITRTGLTQDHTLTISGGSEMATFAISAGYLNQEGVLVYNNFERANLRANSSFKIGKRLRVGENINIARRSVVNDPAQSEQGTISQVYLTAPIIPIYDIGTSTNSDGERDSFGGSKTANTGNSDNPFAELFRGQNNWNRTLNILGNVYAEVSIIEGLRFKSTYSVDMDNFNNRSFSFRTPENQEDLGAQNFREDWNNGFTWTWTNTLSYDKELTERHKLGLLAGYEAIKGTYRNIGGGLNNYFTTDINIWYLNAAFGSPDTRFVNSGGRENTLVSTFGKVDYSFDDTYFLSATVRRDGSSRFSDGFKYGTFPAASFAWRISNVIFQDNAAVTDLKLRASWGKTGNQNIQDYNFADRFGGSIGSAFYDINGTNNSPATGYTQTSIGTLSLGSDTKWEEAETVNFGLDASFFDDRLTFVVDVYSRKTIDLLYNAPLPGTAGTAIAPFRNVASMKNNGFDLGLSYRNRVSDDFSWNVSLNASRYVNEITKIDGESTFFYPNGQQGRIDNRLPEEININQIGYPISSFRGYTVDGKFLSQSDLDALDQTGKTLGGLRFKDLNGDGQINDDDIGIIGNPHPDFTLGLNLGASFKNFDFMAFFNGSFGNDIYNYTKLFTHFRQFFSNVDREFYLNNGQGDLPALNVNDTGSRSSSTYYVEDGTYVRLGVLQIGYNLPLSVGSSIGLSRLKVYIQGQNLFTITGYSGLDPALSNANIGDYSDNIQGNYLNDLWTGYDIGQYPSNRLFTFGVNAEF
ncbi:MAG: TonB-dependent receptor [Lewinellaceae bacterium]|nr:TonB-dependent receptor [Phaeodactylibacter sp.]MCB9036392.1 TonB-dependent receptor [Lewinellaceae bacterium]